MGKPEVIPFGKYKDQPVEVLAQDHEYCTWLSEQEWFRVRYPAIHTLIINNFGQPEETPEHNALQALFVNADFAERFVTHVYGKEKPKLRGVAFEERGYDVSISLCTGQTIHVECKPSVGDDYPAILRQMKAHAVSWENHVLLIGKGGYIGAAVPLEQVRAIFKSRGVDIVLLADLQKSVEKSC
jgi:hypothetical protein